MPSERADWSSASGRRPRSTASTSTVAPGQVRGLLGPNGAGKTTLLRMLFGLIHPDAGSVELLGRRCTGSAARPWRKWEGSSRSLPSTPTCPVRANLGLLARLDARPERGRSARTRSPAWAWSGGARTAWRATRPGCASGWGSRPRCYARRGCCCWTSRRAGSTRRERARSAALVRELAAEGVAVLVSSHQIGELERVCDAYTVMREGRVVWDGSARAADRTGARDRRTRSRPAMTSRRCGSPRTRPGCGPGARPGESSR